MMKKIMTLVVVFMLIATLSIVARSGDKYKLKDIVEWQNTIFLTGIADTSLTGSNDPDTGQETVVGSGIGSKQSAHYINKEGTSGVAGMALVDEFRAKIKLGRIAFFNDAINFSVDLEQRVMVAFGGNGSASATPEDDAILGHITLEDGQYRSYLKTAWKFGGSPVKYTLSFNMGGRMDFNGDEGLDAMRFLPYLGNKIQIAKALDIQINSDSMIRWNMNGAVDSTLNADFRIGSPGQAGGGYHYVKAAAKRGNGYDLGPVSLGWRIRSRVDIGFNHDRWKDQTPNEDQDGICKTIKFRTAEEIWINVLKSVEKTDLNVGGAHFLQLEGDYSYGIATSAYALNDIRMGLELVLDKAFIVGLFARIRTLDWINGAGYALNGDTDQGETYASANLGIVGNDNTNYNAIPAGNGQVGPLIYVGVKKDAFEWVLQYQGFTNFRTYDLYGDNMESRWDAGSTAYYDWRNEIETYVVWYW